MSTWTASATVNAPPEGVIDILTDPDAAVRWSPVPFEVEDLTGKRLATGASARVSGQLAGVRVGFDLDVLEADADRLHLEARGPIGFDVLYELEPADSGAEVHASVSVQAGRGLTGRVLARATDALLGAGALATAVGRIATEAECGSLAVA
jgi:ABC-type amino acid transport substrate-binding protein